MSRWRPEFRLVQASSLPSGDAITSTRVDDAGSARGRDTRVRRAGVQDVYPHVVNSANVGRQRTVLVTGAAGGLGAAAVRRFLSGGSRVAAADLVAPSFGDVDVLALEMDVTDSASIEAGLRRVGDWAPGGLDALVTFAGVTGIGPLMDLPANSIQRVLDINVLGTHRTVRASWPHLRRAGGRIILIGSETGSQHALPLNGPYAMSKHAVEAYADALRRELMFLGTTVVLMQPGPFRTTMTSGVEATFDAVAQDSPFKYLATAAMGRIAGEEAGASDPSVLADAVFEAATATRPRTRYPVKQHRGRALLDRLPVPVVDRLLRLALRPSRRSTIVATGGRRQRV